MYRVAFIVSLVIISAHTALGLSGLGTEAEPWRIETLDDFNEFVAEPNYWDDWIRLETDINLAGLTYTTAVIAPDTYKYGFDFDGAAFIGVFDGNYHKIIGLTIDDGGAGNDYLGLFGCIGEGGQVSSLGLEGGSVSGDDYVVGGLVGWNNRGSILNCYSAGSVNGDWCVGGIVGGNDGNVSNCYSSGDLNGDEYVGGLVGINGDSVSNCYSTGDVSGNYFVGGLVGENYYGSIANCFWDTDTQSHGVTVSIGYDMGTVTNVAGLPTAQMQTESTFTDAGWDFVEIWDLTCDGMNYPMFIWQIPPADFLCPYGVDFRDYSFFAGYWGDTNCGDSNDCNGTDFDLSGTVDIVDLEIFCGYWLEGY
jgi:hypothetical protein